MPNNPKKIHDILLFPFHVPYGILPFEDLSRRYSSYTQGGLIWKSPEMQLLRPKWPSEGPVQLT